MKPNENFKLSVNDISIIEAALNYQLSRLTERRLTHVESTILPENELPIVKEIDFQISDIHNLLGRMHNQKNWYRPKKEVYISG